MLSRQPSVPNVSHPAHVAVCRCVATSNLTLHLFNPLAALLMASVVVSFVVLSSYCHQFKSCCLIFLLYSDRHISIMFCILTEALNSYHLCAHSCDILKQKKTCATGCLQPPQTPLFG